MRGKSSESDDGGGSTPPGETADKLHVHIGTRLRRLFNGVVDEPIPDRFRLLLDELAENKTSDAKADEAKSDASSEEK